LKSQSSPPLARLTGLLAGALSLFAAPAAHAYCRTSTASAPTVDGHVCTPAQGSDQGLPIAWPSPRLTYSLQKNASAEVPFDAFQRVVRAAFDTWQAVDCDGGPPRVEVIEGDPADCARHEYNRAETGLANANIIFFVDAGWDDDPSKYAVTTVTFNVDDGSIYDADMAINASNWHLTTTEGLAGADVDLLSVVTHEAGHFLGLAHALPANADATMHSSYAAGNIDPRDLTDDDRAGICAVYPPAPIAATCDATPRHGFSPLCASDQTGPAPPTVAEGCCCVEGSVCTAGQCVESGGCAVAPAAGARSGWEGAALALIAGALAGRRRRARAG
jgi:MYXO-CTERM domain-containing protein